MATKFRKRKVAGTKKRFVGKPAGQIQQRVQAVGPEHFGVVAVDCAKRRSKWMLCNFYGRAIIIEVWVAQLRANLVTAAPEPIRLNRRQPPCGSNLRGCVRLIVSPRQVCPMAT